MEIKELVPKLVEHYQKCIDEMPEVGWKRYCSNYYVIFGTCYCSEIKFDTDIYCIEFTQNLTNGKPYLCEYPYNASSYSEAKELLQIRLNRLKEFL